MRFKLACWLISVLPTWYPLKRAAVYIHEFASPTPWYHVFWSELREFWNDEVNSIEDAILVILLLIIAGLPIALDYMLTMFLANAYIDNFPELYI